ncbi:MAG: DsbA family protein [Verrucomicrobiota bacterium]|nr:DsbA family protein [Verrucomicrobiota bacterium]
MRRYLPFAIVAAVALVTVAAGTILYRANRMTARDLSPSDMPKAADGGETMHVLGPANAPVTLEEFGDFQCPPCGKLAEPIRDLAKEFGPKLRVIFREQPLPVHVHAREAASAAEAAGLQGKFWAMHELLYREQASWTAAADARPLFSSYAGILGLNLDRFRQDIDSAAVKARVDADKARATAVGATATPTIFVNGHQITGTSLSVAGLRSAIQEAASVATKN